MPARLQPDPVEIRRALSLLVRPGDVFEIRSPEASAVRYDGRPDSRSATAYGYFGNVDTAATVTARTFESADADGVYVTLNPLHSGCLARARNHFRPARGKRTPTTSDKDVNSRRWLYVDLDVDRPAGICATEKEKVRAFEIAQQVDLYLKRHNFPQPIVFDSGSGAALLYRIDLPAEDELVSNVLKVLSEKFTEPGAVKVDTTVGNASRIIRLPGTVNGKGEDDPERPHRLARIHVIPEQILVTPREALEAVAADGAPARKTAPKANGTDVAAEIVERHFPDATGEPYEGGTRWKIACPFNPQHADAAIFSGPDGRPGFHCFHDSCADFKWRDLLARLEPGKVRTPKSRRDEADEPRELVVVNLADVQPEPVDWLWFHRIALGKVALWQGNPGQGKSLSLTEIAAAVTTGAPLPGSSDGYGPADVVILSAEDALSDTIRPRFDAAGGDPRRVHAISFVKRGDREAFFSLADVDLLEALVRKTNARLVIIDPLMAYLGKADAHKDQDVRTALSPLAKMAERTGAAVVCIVHLNKAVGTATALYRSGGSIGIVGAARTAFLVAAHPEDEERHVVACVKSNIGPIPPALSYRITSAPNGSARIRFDRETVNISADRLLVAEAEASSGRGGAVADAENFLRDRLRAGPQLADELKKEAGANGISYAALRRAQKKLHVRAEKRPGAKDSPWQWTLPRSGKAAQAAQGAQVSQPVQVAHLDDETPDGLETGLPDPIRPPENEDAHVERIAYVEHLEHLEQVDPAGGPR